MGGPAATGSRKSPTRLLELASGVDALYLSGRSDLPANLLDRLQLTKATALEHGTPVDFDFGRGRWSLQPGGWGKYRFSLVNELAQLGITAGNQLPRFRFQPRAEFLSGVGPAGTVDWIEDLTSSECGDVRWSVSRLDLYSDWQGWELDGDKRERFVCHASALATYEESCDLTGFVFGRRSTATFAGRIYDKTKQIKEKGLDWWLDVWGDRRVPNQAVVRVEFEIGREGLRQFGLDGPSETLAAIADLWQYATARWLTYRRPTSDQTRSRWPIAAEWLDIQRASFDANPIGLERTAAGRRAGSLRKLLPGLNGYVACAGALLGTDDIDDTVRAIVPLLREYETLSGRRFRDRVAERRAPGAA